MTCYSQVGTEALRTTSMYLREKKVTTITLRFYTQIGTDQARVALRKIASYHMIREPKLPNSTGFGAVTNTNGPPPLH